MLEALRRGSTGLVAKILLSLLILSFGIWGIADVFRGFGRGAVATIGETEITAQEFDRVFRTELDSLSIENDRRISVEEARKEGVDRMVLSKMIGQAALREHANELKLGLSDAAVVEGLRKDPGFAGEDGKFSRTGFNNLLSRLGVSEAYFLTLRRDDDLRQQLSSAVLAATTAPKAIVDLTNAYRNEMRNIEFFRIDANNAVTVPEPDDVKLTTYYGEQKAAYMTPEYRKFNALVASIEALKKEVQISDDELKTAFTNEKETYDTPERRRIQQIAFKDKAAADAAREALVKGTKNFMDVAKEAGAKETDVNLGMLAKKQLIDPKIADAVFALERDAISEVIEGRFTTVVARVIEIEPGREAKFEDTKDKVRDKIATAKASTLLQERADLVEEGRNAGKTLKELSESLKLRLIEVAAIDKDGKSPDGAPALDVPTPERLTRLVFRTEPGAESEPLELGSDGYAWIDVVSVEPPKDKPFDTVKADVKKDYMDSERRRLVKELADKLVERVKSGEDFAKVAKDAGGVPDKVEDVKRNLVPPGLTQEAVEVAFTQPLGGAASALTTDRATRTVMKIAKITPAGDLPKADADKLATELQRELQNDVLIAYVANLQDKLGVSINEAEFKRITGADTPQQ